MESPTFRLTEKDWAAYDRYLRWNIFAVRTVLGAIFLPTYLGVTFAIWAGVVGLDVALDRLGRDMPGAVAFGILICVPPVVVARASARFGKRQASLARLGQPRQLTLDAAGLAVTGSGWESHHDWAIVREIVAAPAFFWFELDRARLSADGVIIPRSAFPSPAAADAFLAEARRLWQAAKDAPPTPTP